KGTARSRLPAPKSSFEPWRRSGPIDTTAPATCKRPCERSSTTKHDPDPGRPCPWPKPLARKEGDRKVGGREANTRGPGPHVDTLVVDHRPGEVRAPVCARDPGLPAGAAVSACGRRRGSSGGFAHRARTGVHAGPRSTRPVPRLPDRDGSLPRLALFAAQE